MPRVSVVVPVYNVESTLPRCLDSILAQSETEIEIICVNDGSSDASPSILAAYATRDRRILLVDRENGGLSAARNSGLGVASGEYVMFVDSDDWIPEDAVAKLYSVARESGLPVVVSARFAKDDLPSRRKGTQWRAVSPALAGFVANRHIRSSVCNKLYHRDVIAGHRFLTGIYFEDWPFNTVLFATIPAFALIAEPMYVYSTKGVSITRSSFGVKKAQSYLAGIDYVRRELSGSDGYPYALRRIACAVKMLVAKTARVGDAEVKRLVAAWDFSGFPLDFKTRFRLWCLRRRLAHQRGSR